MNLSPETIEALQGFGYMTAAFLSLGARIIFLIMMTTYFWATWGKREEPPTWRTFINQVMRQPECSRQSKMYALYEKLYYEWDWEATMHAFLLLSFGVYCFSELVNYWVLGV